MRDQGKITHWNGEKGYGFITPSAGAKQVFVHISSFNNRASPPHDGQLVTFRLSTDKRGRPCAVDVTRAGEAPQKMVKRVHRGGSVKNIAFMIVAVLLAATVGYSKYQKSQRVDYLPVKTSVPQSSLYRCDGRTHCSQMNSCAEATFFIKNCPNTKMDGDGDGRPCESQWCN